jgi:hypothetical protein
MMNSLILLLVLAWTCIAAAKEITPGDGSILKPKGNPNRQLEDYVDDPCYKEFEAAVLCASQPGVDLASCDYKCRFDTAPVQAYPENPTCGGISCHLLIDCINLYCQPCHWEVFNYRNCGIMYNCDGGYCEASKRKLRSRGLVVIEDGDDDIKFGD